MVSNACSRFLATARISPCVVAQGTCFDRKKDDWKGKMQEWSGKRDSNPQPSAWKADALAVELLPQRASLILSRHRLCRDYRSSRQLSVSYSQAFFTYSFYRSRNMVEGGGFEPPKSYDDRFTVCSLWPLGNPSTMSSYLCFLWSWRWDSNPQPADYKSAALPVELRQQQERFYRKPPGLASKKCKNFEKSFLLIKN